eukprot:sb/3475057/
MTLGILFAGIIYIISITALALAFSGCVFTRLNTLPVFFNNPFQLPTRWCDPHTRCLCHQHFTLSLMITSHFSCQHAGVLSGVQRQETPDTQLYRGTGNHRLYNCYLLLSPLYSEILYCSPIRAGYVECYG